jgi:beta-lactamase regulating signal transducer with metallopeptidase domain
MLHLRMDMPLYLMALYGSAMIVIVYVLRRLLRDRLPKFVFPLLWGLVLIRLLVPFSLSSPISAPVPDLRLPESETAVHTVTQGTATSPVGSEEAVTYYGYDGGSDHAPFNWQLALAIAVGLGALATASVLLNQKLRYSRKLADSLLIEHNPTINAILREMGMGDVLVFSNDAIASPLVSGILRPRIYLPAAMDFRQTVLLRHILVHETMHIKRKDNGLKAVMLLVLCLHWYNPLVWLMAKCLASDLEAACDAAVLKQTGVEERKSYAASLLAMAITGNRFTLLYSAFSKTEVERRMKNVLGYRKATSFMLALSIVVVMGGSVVFATGGQAPFSADLSSYCGSTSSKWGVRAELTRDIALGQQAGERADKAIFAVLAADSSGDPAVIADQVKATLANEFGVEKSAFRLRVDLNLSEEELAKEYAGLGLTKGADGFYRYKGEAVRLYQDVMLGSLHTRNEGTVDLTIERDRLGAIKSVNALHKGDSEFDRRSQEMDRRITYGRTRDRTSRSTSLMTSQENDFAVNEVLTEGTSGQ